MSLFSPKPSFKLVIVAIAIVLGAVALIFLTVTFTKRGYVNVECTKKYPLTSGGLDCDRYDESTAIMKELRSDLQEISKRLQNENKVERISIWVRDLESKQWAAVNELETYSPASLLKVPLMIAYYKYAELSPQVLTTEIQFTSSTNENGKEHFKPVQSMEVGEKYTVEELIRRMIEQSDNDAATLLYNSAEKSFYNKVLLDLGIQVPTQDTVIDYVTTKTYSNILRVLYNASYLDRDASEHALELLTNSAFKGIADPLPKEVDVAHKFGERLVVEPDNSISTHQLHDCGIVYKKNRAYSLCVMTEGKDFDILLSAMQAVSSLVYSKM